MSVKIRLQRQGKKRYPFYYIIVADSRSPRDGKYIERIGTYNPNTHPATIEIDNEKAVDWLQKGAQPTTTTRRILKYKGVLYRKHLLRGVRKGVLTLEEADQKYADWIKEHANKILDHEKSISEDTRKRSQAQLEAEIAVNKKREQDIAAKRAKAEEELKAAAREAAGEEAEETEEVQTEATAETEQKVAETQTPEAPKTEAPKTEAPEEKAKDEGTVPADEVKEETPVKEQAPAEEVKEQPPAEEVKEQAPEEKSEETPKEEAKQETPKPEAKAEEPEEEKAPEAKQSAKEEEKKEEDGDKNK